MSMSKSKSKSNRKFERGVGIERSLFSSKTFASICLSVCLSACLPGMQSSRSDFHLSKGSSQLISSSCHVINTRSINICSRDRGGFFLSFPM